MATIKIITKYSIGDTVYIFSDEEQRKCQIVSIVITPIGYYYVVSMGGNENSDCYEIELSDTKQVI